MAWRFNSFSMSCLAVVACAFSLGACSSGTTYGTGKSQEAQLFEDIGGLASFGMGKKKERIAYNARPGLVSPADKNALPAPVDENQTAAGYFPVDPEVARQQRLNNTAKADERSPS